MTQNDSKWPKNDISEMSRFTRFARHKFSAARHLKLFCTPDGNLHGSQNFKLEKNIPNLSNYGNVGNLEKINMIIHLMRVNSSDQTCADT